MLSACDQCPHCQGNNLIPYRNNKITQRSCKKVQVYQKAIQAIQWEINKSLKENRKKNEECL